MVIVCSTRSSKIWMLLCVYYESGKNSNLLLELIISTKKNTPSKQDIHAHLTTSADHIFICLWLKWRNDEGKSYALSINGWTRSNLTYKVINALFCLWIIWLFCSLSSIRRSFTHLSVFVCVWSASQTQFKWLQI